MTNLSSLVMPASRAEVAVCASVDMSIPFVGIVDFGGWRRRGTLRGGHGG
jgi:hypothetical protein